MTLESGPAKADRNYWTLVTVLCLGMSGWFFYDGAIGWNAKNRAEALKELPKLLGRPADDVKLADSPTEEDFKKLYESKPTTPQQVAEKFGTPIHTSREAGGETYEYYASLYGLATARSVNGRILPEGEGLKWKKWNKNKDEIQSQFYWAMIPLVLCLYTGMRAYRASTLRVTVDDSGLTYAGKRIPMESITSIRDYSPRGWVDLYHKDGETETRLRLDNQKIGRFDEVVDALCVAKGVPNPIKEFERPDDSSAGGDAAASRSSQSAN